MPLWAGNSRQQQVDRALSVGKILQKSQKDESYFSRDQSNEQTSLDTPAAEASKTSKDTVRSNNFKNFREKYRSSMILREIVVGYVDKALSI